MTNSIHCFAINCLVGFALFASMKSFGNQGDLYMDLNCHDEVGTKIQVTLRNTTSAKLQISDVFLDDVFPLWLVNLSIIEVKPISDKDLRWKKVEGARVINGKWSEQPSKFKITQGTTVLEVGEKISVDFEVVKYYPILVEKDYAVSHYFGIADALSGFEGETSIKSNTVYFFDGQCSEKGLQRHYYSGDNAIHM